MKRMRVRRGWGAAAIVVLCIVALAIWQWQVLARFALVTTADSIAHVRISFRQMTLRLDHGVFDDVRIASLQNEPIAEIPRLTVSYDLKDLFPGGRRLFGLKSVEADSPHVTIVRHADGSYNIPIPSLQANRPSAQPPLILTARVTSGSIDVVDQRPQAVPGEDRVYIANLNVNADISTKARARYGVDLQYGERPGQFYPVHGRGDMNPSEGYINQRWTASALPIAAAVNFVADSTSLRFLGGTLHDLDARYVGLPDANATMRTHLAASALLSGGRISIAGLSRPVEDVRGPVDVYDNGLLTPRFDAILAGAPVRISGGIYGLRNPRLRMTIQGTADSARLRSAFTQAQRLPISGPVAFGLLVEGATAKPTTWIDLRSPHLTYAATSLDRVAGLVEFDGREADVIGLRSAYRQLDVTARGRITFARQPGAVNVLVGVQSPPGGIPYVGALLPQMAVHGTALATSDDPKTIGVQGALWGTSATQRLDALFNVDGRGMGSVGPVHITAGRSSLYARIALDGPHHLSLGLIDARDFPIAAARATANGTIFVGQAQSGIAAGLTGRLAGSWGDARANGRVALANGRLHGALFGNVPGQASFGAAVAGTPQSPHVSGTVVVAGGRYRSFDVNGNAGIAYADGALQLHDTVVAVGPLFAGVAGTIQGVSPHGTLSPRYDLATQLHSSDISALLATVQPRTASLVQGSLDANLRVRGTGSAPSFSGTVSAPEGSVNGLAFRGLRGDVSGGLGALSVRTGQVTVGSTAVALKGAATPARARVTIDAPHTDLADFNDFFDAGDTFAGTGRLALQATLNGSRVVATNGSARFSNARFRRIALGKFSARWQTTGRAVDTLLSFGGPTGEVHVTGSAMPADMAVDMHATAHSVDLATWLPMLGFIAPITGRLDAQTAFSGRYPDIAMNLHAAVLGGTAGRMQVERFEISATAQHGRSTIQSAILQLPSVTTTISGTFGLRESDPMALVAHSTSPNVGALLLEATGKDPHLSGTLDSTLHVEGSHASPRLRDAVTLQSVRYRNLTIPRIVAAIEADRRALRIASAEVDLERGKALLSAIVPIAITSSGIKPGAGPIAASFRADDVELSNFLALLPKDTKTSGRVDGEVVANGSLDAPQLGGSLALRNGTFSGPMERSPISGVVADLSFAGTRAQLQSRAAVGGGSLTAEGTASIPNLRRPADATVNLHALAQNARLNLPDYFQGLLNADVSLERAASNTTQMSGSIAVSNARIPLNAFLNKKGGAQAQPTLPNVAFNNVRITAGPNVRVQSANVDIGATGDVTLAGTLNAPNLAGVFRSTGGSLNFYRNFNLESGTVRFDRSSGVIPDVNAVATTFVANPATAIRLHVTGPVTNMNLALASQPAYSRQQILGLLVGAQQFGAVRGVQANAQNFSAGSAAANVALGHLNTLFTRNLLQPLSSSLAGTLGFTEVQITSDLQSGLGVNAVKAFGKNVRAIFAQTFGYPQTQSITLEANPTVDTGLRLTAYTSQGPTLLALQQPQSTGLDVLNLNPLTSFTPLTGTNGISFAYLRRFP
jgi:autotransporter translocation and assembly factor TamB